MSGPLKGIRVLDLTWVLAGPFATMILSDLGADVIKVERPEVGDISRGNGPYVRGLSTYFLSLNRGKKSIVLDLKSEKGKEVFFKLVEHVDVLVENFTPGTMDKMGLGYDTLKKRNPKLIYAACSGFGQTGPYAGKPSFDIIAQAAGGIMSITGEPGRPPVKVGAAIGDISAGLFMCIAILACLRERNVSGEGQMIDISLLDCQVSIQENAFVRYLNTGEVPVPLGTRHPVFAPFQVFPTKDNYIAVAMMGGVGNQWELYCAVIGHLELIDDERFQTGWDRAQNFEVLEPVLTAAMKTKTTGEWLRELEEVGIPCGPLNTIDKVAADPQVISRDMILEVKHPRAGSFRVANTPFKLSRSRNRPAKASPDLGEDTRQVLAELLGMSERELSALNECGAISCGGEKD